MASSPTETSVNKGEAKPRSMSELVIELKDMEKPQANTFAVKKELAQNAFQSGDAQLSKQVHRQGIARGQESHTNDSGQYIKSVVFGGLDGIVTTFAVVAGIFGADLPARLVLVLGVANMVADGVSMGFGDFLSTQAELEYARTERARESWELENYPEGEKEEMVEIYMNKHGFTEQQANTVINILSQNKKFFVDHMLVEELNLMPPAEDEEPWKNGVVTFLAFNVFGFIPLIPSLIFYHSEDKGLTFGISILFTALTLFALGVLKGKLSGRPLIRSGLYVFFNGGLAAASSYLIGYGLGKATGVSGN